MPPPVSAPMIVNDSRSVPHLLVSSAAAYAIALVDPRGLDQKGLRVYRAANCAYTGWMTWAVLSTESPDLSRRSRAGAAVGGAALVMASARWNERLDGRIHERLSRWGVRRPRVVLAVGSTALGALGWWRSRQDATAEDQQPES